MPYTASRLSSLVMARPRASASSFSQLERQLRQKPARFIKSIFWTSVRARKCSSRRLKAAASSSVVVLSLIAIVIFPPLQNRSICGPPSQILPDRVSKRHGGGKSDIRSERTPLTVVSRLREISPGSILAPHNDARKFSLSLFGPASQQHRPDRGLGRALPVE